MSKLTNQLMDFKHRLIHELDKTEAIGGHFLSSLIRDSFVRHFHAFAHPESLSKIAYKASCAAIVTVSARLRLGSSTLQQIPMGVLLGLMAVGATKDICKPIILGSRRGIRKVIETSETYVTDTFVLDIISGLSSVFDSVQEIAEIEQIASEVISAENYRVRTRHDNLVFV